MTTGQIMQTIRKQKGYTQKQLAEKCGFATGTIQQYELNKREPRREQLQKIADALDVPLYELMGFNGSIRVGASIPTDNFEQIQCEKATVSAPKFTDKPILKKGTKVTKKVSNFFTRNQEEGTANNGKPPKFTDKGMSREESQARYEIEVLFNTILDEGNLDSVREKNIALLHEILTSYSNLNEIGRELAVVKIKELGYSSATTDSQLDDIYFKRVMKKVNNGEDLTQAEIEWRYAYLDKSLKRIGDDFEAFYSMLNRTGREIAWTKINHIIEEIELLTKIPKYSNQD